MCYILCIIWFSGKETALNVSSVQFVIKPSLTEITCLAKRKTIKSGKGFHVRKNLFLFLKDKSFRRVKYRNILDIWIYIL